MNEETAKYELERALQKIEIMEHALGNKTFYRNHYACGPGADSFELIQELVESGFMEEGKKIADYSNTQMRYYHVTDKGKSLVFHGAK